MGYYEVVNCSLKPASKWTYRSTGGLLLMMCHGRRRLAANDYDSVLGRKAGCAVPGCVSTLCSAHPGSPVHTSWCFVSLLVQFPLAHSRCPAAHLPASQRCPGQPLPSWCWCSSPAASQPRANILQVVNCSQGPEGHPACLSQMGGSDKVLKGRKLFQTTEVVVMSLATQGKFKKSSNWKWSQNFHILMWHLAAHCSAGFKFGLVLTNPSLYPCRCNRFCIL